MRAFGTQLLCEQVIGRALRRQSYDLNDDGLFNVEYADVLGIPFDFTAKPVVAPPQPPRETDSGAGRAPGARLIWRSASRASPATAWNCREERLTANFNADSVLELTPELVGPTVTNNSGIIGEGSRSDRRSTWATSARPRVLYHLTQHLIYTNWRDPGEEPKLYLFGQLKRIAQANGWRPA